MIPPLSQWPPDLLELFYERAAIMEFDGGMPLEEARRKAMADVWPQQELR